MFKATIRNLDDTLYKFGMFITFTNKHVHLLLKKLLLCSIPIFFLYGCGSTIHYNYDRDAQIQGSINDQLFTRFRNNAKVEALFMNNKLVVIGYAGDDSTKQMIQAFTSSTFSNYKIYNEVQISAEFKTISLRSANDIKIENEILSEFWFKKRLLKVRSLNGNVYLMGIVSNEQRGGPGTSRQIGGYASRLSNVKDVFMYFDFIGPGTYTF